MRRLILGLLMFSLEAQAFEWSDLWLTRDQQAMRLLEENPAEAASLFEQPAWRGVGDYRAGKYQQAVEEFEKLDSAKADYNLGNSLAKAGQLEQAVAVYDDLLKDKKLDGQLREDAQFNRDLVKKLLQQQQNQQQNQQQSAEGNPPEENESSQGSEPQADVGQAGAPQDSAGEQMQDSAESESAQAQTERQNDAEQQQPAEPQQSETNNARATDSQQQAAAGSETPMSEEQQATEQWLRRIPDDPSGLLRRKLQQAHRSNYPNIGDGGQAW